MTHFVGSCFLTQPTNANVHTGPHCVLCVDDDPDTLKLRRFLLEAAGYVVRTAGSGAQALAMMAADNAVDLVLLDYRMPGMNGDELAHKLRQQYRSVPLIAVSAVGQLPAEFLEAVDSQVQKGHDPETLLSAIAKVLAQSPRPPAQEPAFLRTVLCVEDNPIELQLRKLLFESAGFAVLQARSASAALEIFAAQPVDAVVLDYWLSDRNGTLVAEEMKRSQPRIPIVMLSGYSPLPGEGVVVDGWLRKAEAEPEEIVNCVKRLISFRMDTQKAVSP
jgi:CheY-like chemotaxis protein